MTIELLIDQMERELGHSMPVDRMVVQSMLEQSLQHLASSEEFDFLKRSLEPLLQTEPSVREYALPADFPVNFTKFTDPDTGEVEWACKLDDATSAYTLRYEAPEVFYRRDLSAESDARPTNYTVSARTNGSKQIVLAPPPDTTNSRFLKNGPSQVAQYETPLPANASSPSTPSFLGVAPVAIITALASYSSEAVKTLNGLFLKSTLTTSSSTIVVPIRSVCFRKAIMRSGPIIPSTKPG